MDNTNPNDTSPKRVVVFIDYQNVYKSARRCFCPHTTNHADGQINPFRVGLKLKGVGNAERTLHEVRVYRGLPSNKQDPKGYAAARRQIDLWANLPKVQPITRGLNYRDPQRPREKGIDVAIAVDFFAMAARGEYDVGVLFSGDTDLLPALEAVTRMDEHTRPDIEVATWSNDNQRDARQLRLSRDFGGGPPCHHLRLADYGTVHDPTNYAATRRRR